MFMFDLEIGHKMRQAAISIYEFTHLLLKIWEIPIQAVSWCDNLEGGKD